MSVSKRRRYPDLGDVLKSAVPVVGRMAMSYAKNLTKKNYNQVEVTLNNAYREGEEVERKRLPPVRYRLHAAKYLTMDKMLASLFFPVQKLVNHFGLTSYSGVNERDAEAFLNIPKGVTGIMRTKGQYRGVAFFSIRNTDVNVGPNTAETLNADPKQIGAIKRQSPSGTFAIDSIYRPFHNGPMLNGGIPTDQKSDGNEVAQTAFQDMVEYDSADDSKVRDCSMGINLFQVEAASLNAMCYADPIIANGRLATPNAPVSNLNNTEISAYGSSGNIGVYNNSLYTSYEVYNGQVRDAVVRIIDGKLVMDIMNTENTPCVVEIVIHSKKKNNIDKQQIYNRFYLDAQNHYATSGKTQGSTAQDANFSGGWQTFYDPQVPMLRLPKSATVYTLITEVHRSNHILAPGQSKCVTIDLGNHWYKLRNKNDLSAANGHDFLSYKDNVGTLFVAIGHSGFLYPQSIATMARQQPEPAGEVDMYMTPQANFIGGSGVTATMPGTGWWTGVTHTPSSILVSGTYSEKFYPMTFDRSQVDETLHMVPRGAYIDSGAGTRTSVPTMQILSDKVVTSETSFKDNTFNSEL